ncbi:type II toxin-antitoxin system Phd/YefM family antitoxin [Nocardia sp. NPDC004582]
MKTIDSAELRASWRVVLAAVRTGAEAFVILRHGRPEAVLLSAAQWLTGCVNVPVAEVDRRARAASDVRSGLRAVRTAAHASGQHTLIQKQYGPLFKDGSAAHVEAVIAPYDWVRRSLPELAAVRTPSPWRAVVPGAGVCR